MPTIVIAHLKNQGNPARLPKFGVDVVSCPIAKSAEGILSAIAAGMPHSITMVPDNRFVQATRKGWKLFVVGGLVQQGLNINPISAYFFADPNNADAIKAETERVSQGWLGTPLVK